MPSASVKIAPIAKEGDCRSCRTAYRRSCGIPAWCHTGASMCTPSGDLKILADAVERDAVRLISRGGVEARDRLEVRLTAERERLMVHRQDELGPGVVCHLPRLLGCAVVVDPWVVRANGHDGQIEWPRTPHRAEGRRNGSVAAEENAAASHVDGVVVIAAIRIVAHTGAPVIHLEGADGRGSHLRAL